MKYLLLIPACLSMLLAVFFVVAAACFKWHARWVTPVLLAFGFLCQIGAIWIAAAVDR